MSYAEVVLNISTAKSYTYEIPDELDTPIVPGIRVLVPLGTREVTGVVVSVSETSQYQSCKAIIDVLDEIPLVSDELLNLTYWMAGYYQTAWGQVIPLTLPRGTDRFSRQSLFPVDEMSGESDQQLTEKQKYLYDIVCREPGKSVNVYQNEYGTGAFRYLMNQLIKKGFLRREQMLEHERIKERLIRYVTVSLDFQEQSSVFRGGIDTLLPLRGQSLSLKDFRRKTGFSPSKIKRLAEKKVIAIEERKIQRIPEFTYRETEKKIVLSEKQHAVLDILKTEIGKETFAVCLLHGVTGSGKTQVYLEAIKHVLENGKSAVVLIPEISLTPQTVGRFNAFFPGKVAVFHSKMSLGERFDAWYNVYNGNCPIVVGPRSALFMPLKNIGIIVVDEEHDSSYKQSSAMPRYHARDVAVYRGKLNQATVLLGSATPSLESYYNAEKGKYTLLHLPERVSGTRLPQVLVVDMCALKKGSTIFSPLLIEKISKRLQDREQVILLQNRRGYASFFQCRTCGFIARCSNCEISLTYHAYNRKLQCHYCGYMRDLPDRCPNCSGNDIKYRGTGTQRIEEELIRLFPQSRFLRMDLDTTSGKNAHDRLLHLFHEGKADILLGTQMIAKGLDFEKVTLVGVVSADIGLSLPDFRAAERVFQLLTQVAGRAGRREYRGEVVIQTHQISHYAIQYAREHDYTGFYREEMQYRKSMQYPPYVRITTILISGKELSKTITTGRQIGSILRKRAKSFYTVTGPAPAPISKLKNRYRWQLLVKLNIRLDPQGSYLKNTIASTLKSYLNLKSEELTVTIDVDPVDML